MVCSASCQTYGKQSKEYRKSNLSVKCSGNALDSRTVNLTASLSPPLQTSERVQTRSVTRTRAHYLVITYTMIAFAANQHVKEVQSVALAHWYQCWLRQKTRVPASASPS